MTVFLSYAHEDRERAEQLVAALTHSGLAVWWDGLIVGGAEFAQSTEQALEAAGAVIVLWSRSSVGSHWVRDEATRGRDRNCLVPLTLDGSEPPIGFRQYLVLNFSAWSGDAAAGELQSLLRAVRAAQKGEPPAAPPYSLHAGVAARPLLSRRALVAGAGLAVGALGAGGWYGWRRYLGGGLPIDSSAVAVLPFANISSDHSEDYFAEGLSAEVRAVLAHDQRLHVMAQNSSEAFRGSKPGARSIAQALGVAFLLEGNVRRAGNTVRIEPLLVDGRTGFSLWAQTFDRPIDDIFAVQSEIAGFVLAELSRRIQGATGSASPRPAPALPGGTNNVAAYEAYLRGRADYQAFAGEASDRRALGEFDTAIAADPHFAAAHAARARSLIVIANQYEDAAHTAGTYEQAARAARTAVELAPDLADAQSTLGFVLFQGRLDVAGAREPYEISNRLGSGDATVLGRYALYCALTGRDSIALAAMTHAVALDPLNPLVHRALGTVHYAARRYERSLAPLRKALALNSKLSNAYGAIGRSLLMLGRVVEARAAFVREPHELLRATGLAIVERRLGNGGAAQQALEQLRTDLGDSALYQQAQVAAQWGERDRAIALLIRARDLGDSGLIYLQTDPLLDSLRSHPAFNELRRRLGFE